MEKITTIQLSENTKQKLESLKQFRRETYDELVSKLIELAEEDKMEFSKETKKAIKEAREDIKKGRVLSTKDLIKELNI